jgi:hypothetical protein
MAYEILALQESGLQPMPSGGTLFLTIGVKPPAFQRNPLQRDFCFAPTHLPTPQPFFASYTVVDHAKQMPGAQSAL